MYKVVLNIALKNAFLRKSRAILLILMIGMSMGTMLAIEGLYDGMATSMIEKTKRSDSGEISIYAKEYRINKDIKYQLKNTTDIINKLKTIPSVTSVTQRFKVDGLSQSATKAYPSSLIGINLKDEELFGQFSEFKTSGDFNLGKRGCIVAKELAKKLKLKLNSKLIFTTRDINGDIKSILFRVKAIVQTTNINIDNKAVFIDKTKIISYLGVDEDSSTQIAIRVDNEDNIKTIKELFSEYDTLDFKEINPLLKQMQDMMKIFNSITFFIVMFVVFIGILGVMYVSILDRIREFGIMLALGYNYKYIKYQVIFEALFLGISGFIMGAIIGYILLSYLQVYGFDLSNFADGMASFGMSSILYADLKFSYFSSSFYAIILASILSVFLPLRKIKKLNPVDVIKAEK